LVNDCGSARRIDFKRQFEVLQGCESPILAAFGLTGSDTMLINAGIIEGGTQVRLISLILVSKRTAGGG
jgi:hypothetical protein